MKTKYDIGQEVFSCIVNKIRKVKIDKIESWRSDQDSICIFYQFEEDHDLTKEEDVFGSIQELIDDLKIKFPEEFEEETKQDITSKSCLGCSTK